MSDREAAGNTPAAGRRPAGAAGGRAGPPMAARPGRTPLLVAVALCSLVMAG